MQQPGSGAKSSWRSGPNMKQRRLALARFIKGRRESLEIGLQDAAARVGTSRWSYADWETGVSSIKVEILPALAQVLRVSVRDLIDQVVGADPKRSPRRAKQAAAA